MGEEVSFHHCMLSSSGCSSNGGYFEQGKPPGDNGTAHKGNWQTRKTLSIFLARTRFLYLLQELGKRVSVQGVPERAYLSLNE